LRERLGLPTLGAYFDVFAEEFSDYVVHGEK